ncbi:hypothetical protein LMG9449_0558 [Lactococcus lactis subsp. lactis]|uniref:Uncharacterized protein n=1 Tax=Lactococcus lactis subsp. lactis TaxID=1360 RepID=A0A0V8E4W0_LACLL|nr:hypothetical protein LMG9449_0558 [Lactococcus lactis subsp. lactis]
MFSFILFGKLRNRTSNLIILTKKGKIIMKVFAKVLIS